MREAVSRSLCLKYVLVWSMVIAMFANLTGCTVYKRSASVENTQSAPYDKLFSSILKSELERASRAYEKGFYTDAINISSGLISRYPGREILRDAQWILARSLDSIGDLDAAIRQYELFSKNYPSGRYSETARTRYKLLLDMKYIFTSNDLRIDVRRTGRLTKENRPEFFDLRYDKKHDRFVRYDKLDIFNPDVRRYIRTLLSMETIDKSLVSFEIMYKPDEGFSNSAIASFNREFGLSLTRDELAEALAPSDESDSVSSRPALFWKWVGWRTRFILDFVEEASNVVKKQNHEVKTALLMDAVVINNSEMGIATRSQDLLEAYQRAFDYIVVSGKKTTQELYLEMQEKVNWMLGEDNRVLLNVVTKG